MVRECRLKEAIVTASGFEYNDSRPRQTSLHFWCWYSPVPDDGGPVVPADLRHVAVPGPGRRAQVVAVHRPAARAYQN